MFYFVTLKSASIASTIFLMLNFQIKDVRNLGYTVSNGDYVTVRMQNLMYERNM